MKKTYVALNFSVYLLTKIEEGVYFSPYETVLYEEEYQCILRSCVGYSDNKFEAEHKMMLNSLEKRLVYDIQYFSGLQEFDRHLELISNTHPEYFI